LQGSRLCRFGTVLFLTVASAVAQEASITADARKVQAPDETIIVTGTFTPTPESEIDRAVTVVEADPQHNVYSSWVDLLELVPSVDLRQRGPSNIQGDLSIRGSGFGETLVLLNGFRMDDAQTGHHDMDLPVPTAAVERVEVMSGAGSALYGSDAMAGSVNVIIGRPEQSGIRVGAGVGNLGINQQSGSASVVWGKLDAQIDAERDFSSGFRPDRDYRSATFFGSTGLQTRLGRSLLMFAYGDKPYGADQFYGPFNSWERTKSWFAAFKQAFGSNTEFDFAFRRHTDEFVLFRDNPSVYENNHIDRSWQTGIRRREQVSKNSTLFFGAEGIHENIESNNLGNHARSRGAVYLDYDVRALKRFSFSVAAREEIFSRSHGEFNPTVAAGVWLRSTLKLKASVSRAFRLPSYTDWEYHDPANFGNPKLGPEEAWDYEGGLLWIPSSRWKGEVTVFERRDGNVIDYVTRVCTGIPVDQLPPGATCSPMISSVYHAENLQHLNFTGVEASADFRLSGQQHVNIAYTALYGSQETLTGLQTKYAFNYPSHHAVLGWNGKLPGTFYARTRLGVIERYQSEPYAVWDAAILREFNHVAAHIAFANISDTEYQEIPGVIMPGRSVVFGLDFFWRSR
jgi:outer membrane cobalamin receptor